MSCSCCVVLFQATKTNYNIIIANEKHNNSLKIWRIIVVLQCVKFPIFVPPSPLSSEVSTVVFFAYYVKSITTTRQRVKHLSTAENELVTVFPLQNRLRDILWISLHYLAQTSPTTCHACWDLETLHKKSPATCSWAMWNYANFITISMLKTLVSLSKMSLCRPTFRLFSCSFLLPTVAPFHLACAAFALPSINTFLTVRVPQNRE